MTVPTNIPEKPMAQPDPESLQEFKDANSPRSMEVPSTCTTKGTGHQGCSGEQILFKMDEIQRI